MNYDPKYVEELKELIEKHPFNYIRSLKSKGFKGRYPDRTELLDYVIKSTQHMCDDSFEYSLKTRVFWIVNGISSWDDERVKCQVCGKPIKHWNIIDKDEGYKKTCSKECDRKMFSATNKAHMKEKYGVENAFQLPEVLASFKERKDEIQAKRDSTRKKHFGDAPGWNLKQSIATRKAKYGSTWNLDAIRATKEKNHGDPNWNNPEKNFQTKLKNGSVTTSKPEERVYALLCQKYGESNIERQWKDDAYPFACDFFLKTSKTYIECNFSWTHGEHFFDETSEEDLKRLEDLKSKKTDYYDNAIETWTKRDLLKKKTAEDNHLDYKVFWDLKEAAEWILGREVELTRSGNVLLMTKKEAEAIFQKNGREAFEKFKEMKYPFTELDEVKASKEIQSLRTRSLKDSYPSHIIDALAKERHLCCKGKKMSPLKFWEALKDELNFNTLWHDLYVNRLQNCTLADAHEARATGIMSAKVILSGFSAAHLAEFPSYFKPHLAKRLVKTYLDEFDEVFCPFNGFSGIMLGVTVGCGKRYVGQDLSPRLVEEANQMIDFVKTHVSTIDAIVKRQDIFKDLPQAHQCLIACPPYGDGKGNNLETWNFNAAGKSIDVSMTCDQWIDECLKRYNCQRYLFVVDEKSTIKWADCTRETLTNRSHYGQNHELVVVIDKNDINKH